MAKLCLKNIYKSFESEKVKKQVLSDINLEIEDKSFCILLGPSGCGKSTLLRLIAGLEQPDSGEIFIDDKKVNDIHPKDRDIAFVFQSYALYPHLTVYENMAFPLKIRNEDKKTIEKKVKEAASILGLEELLKRKPKELSGGQRQRVALGRAIVRNAKIFLMDEPLSNLDAKLRANMRVEIKKLHQKLNTTFIYVTHDQTEALTMGDRIAIIDKGIIQQTDIPQNIYNNPVNTFVGGFLGSPAMNFIKSDIINGQVNINGKSFELNESQKYILKDRSSVLLGIRAESFNEPDANFNFPAAINIKEMLGNEQVIYFNANNKECAAILPPSLKIDNEILFKINTGNILFFDPETGMRI